MKFSKVDVYVASATIPKLELTPDWKLTDIFSRGTKVGPAVKFTCLTADVFQCRVEWIGGGELKRTEVAKLLTSLSAAGVSWSDVHLILE